MSIYSKSVSDISTEDLRQLLEEQPVENIRLEFKSTLPSRDEFLKKASGFANTYGGILIIGASASSKDGKLESLPGITAEPGLKQRLVQWTFDGLAPPLDPFVSEPISTPADATKFCYVVSIPESLVAPHFINGRRGAYVRTDEFSGRFDAQLATYDELVHLADRRSLAVKRREQLLRRAEDRFSTLEQKGSGPPQAVLTLFLCPAYPAISIFAQDRLFPLLGSSGGRWRSMGFPNTSQPVSQHESAILLAPAGEFSVIEATIWGSLYYGTTVQEKVEGGVGIHLHRLVGTLLVFLAHAGRYYSQGGFDGLLWLRPSLRRIGGLPLIAGPGRSGGEGSPIDIQVDFDFLVSSERLKSDLNGVTIDILRTLCFALNWHEVTAADPDLKTLLNLGYEYNFWRTHRY